MMMMMMMMMIFFLSWYPFQTNLSCFGENIFWFISDGTSAVIGENNGVPAN
jgi:hypothetical protein